LLTESSFRLPTLFYLHLIISVVDTKKKKKQKNKKTKKKNKKKKTKKQKTHSFHHKGIRDSLLWSHFE